SGKAEGQTEVLQLHEIEVSRRILGYAFQQIEEPLTPRRLAMQRHQQGMMRPFALVAPRRGKNRFVESRAQHVARPDDDVINHSGSACLLLESPDLLQCVPAQSRGVHL